MNNNYVQGVGFILHGVGELLVNPTNASVAFTEILKGFGLFGTHKAIAEALQTPRGQAAQIFQTETPKSE